MTEQPARVPAVLDTSFWVLACRAEIAANSLDLFDIVVPDAVAAEIMAREPGAASREVPIRNAFPPPRDKFRRPEVQVTPLQAFGPGEAEAIALAAKLGAVLLINEQPGAHYSRNIGIDVATVPSVIVLLRAQGVISDSAARKKLELITANTARSIIDDAIRVLDALLRDD